MLIETERVFGSRLNQNVCPQCLDPPQQAENQHTGFKYNLEKCFPLLVVSFQPQRREAGKDVSNQIAVGSVWNDAHQRVKLLVYV